MSLGFDGNTPAPDPHPDPELHAALEMVERHVQAIEKMNAREARQRRELRQSLERECGL